MQTFTGAEYLMIDAANNYGLDKDTYGPRLQWVRDNLDSLEDFIMEADEPILYAKSVMAIREAQQGNEIGHLVELDATTSGIQIMSALTGCYNGALWTNLIEEDKRYDCYTEAFKDLKSRLGEDNTFSLLRSAIKNALMTGFYGSAKEPEKEFGEDTPELAAFYTTCSSKLPGAWELRNELLDIWQPYTEAHEFTLPDGFCAHIKVTAKETLSCEIDELDHHTFNHTYEKIQGKRSGVSLAANVIHSLDGYIVRELGRRCNYDYNQVSHALRDIDLRIAMEGIDTLSKLNLDKPISLKLLDAPIHEMDVNTLLRTKEILEKVLEVKSHPIITIHDAFKAHPNNCNNVRYWYKELLAELAESDILSSIFSEITGQKEKYLPVKGGISKTEMAAYIRKSNYPIC